MEGSVHKFFTQDTYYLRSNFNVKILRLFNIKRDEGYIISFSDSTVTKINHKKKRFAVYTFNEFLEESKNIHKVVLLRKIKKRMMNQIVTKKM